MPNFKGWLAVLFIIFTLAIPFALTYYASTETFKDRYRQWRNQNENASIPSRSSIKRGEISLVKDNPLQSGRTRLVYRGIKGKKIILDVFLLDLDPETAYPRQIEKDNIKTPLMFGDDRYLISSVSKHYLRLEILNSFSTP